MTHQHFHEWWHQISFPGKQQDNRLHGSMLYIHSSIQHGSLYSMSSKHKNMSVSEHFYKEIKMWLFVILNSIWKPYWIGHGGSELHVHVCVSIVLHASPSMALSAEACMDSELYMQCAFRMGLLCMCMREKGEKRKTTIRNAGPRPNPWCQSVVIVLPPPLCPSVPSFLILVDAHPSSFHPLFSAPSTCHYIFLIFSLNQHSSQTHLHIE